MWAVFWAPIAVKRYQNRPGYVPGYCYVLQDMLYQVLSKKISQIRLFLTNQLKPESKKRKKKKRESQGKWEHCKLQSWS